MPQAISSAGFYLIPQDERRTRTGHQTEFEKLADELGIDSNDLDALAASPEMRTFVKSNRNRKFVPEPLLTLLKIEVDIDE
jgi:hypothetical protein